MVLGLIVVYALLHGAERATERMAQHLESTRC